MFMYVSDKKKNCIDPLERLIILKVKKCWIVELPLSAGAGGVSSLSLRIGEWFGLTEIVGGQ